jgi:hypothetical protein
LLATWRPRPGEALGFSRGRGDVWVPRSKQTRARVAQLAEWCDVDEATVIEGANGRESIPDQLIGPLADHCGFSAAYLMRSDAAPRSVTSEDCRRLIAENVAERAARIAPGECEGILDVIEQRLTVEGAMPDESPGIPRLQRLRVALLEFLSEPTEPVA